jgi:hypothetical protein
MLLVYSLTACALAGAGLDGMFYSAPPPGLLSRPPEISAGAPSASVIVFRDDVFAGSLLEHWLTLDRRLIASLRIKQRVEFDLAPGKHEIAVHCTVTNSWQEKVLPLDVVAGETYFLLMSAKLGKCALMEPIPSTGAARWIERTQKIPLPR